MHGQKNIKLNISLRIKQYW